MEGSIKELSAYRYETAKENLQDARIMYDNGRYKNALNRAYYAIFHSVRAVIALDGFDSSKHSGVIAFFNQNYVKNGTFTKDLSRIIREASEKREKADYLDFYVASKDEAEKQILRADYFLKRIEQYLITEHIIEK
jgi:uncharacterized protein (UPF0332 family)